MTYTPTGKIIPDNKNPTLMGLTSNEFDDFVKFAQQDMGTANGFKSDVNRKIHQLMIFYKDNPVRLQMELDQLAMETFKFYSDFVMDTMPRRLLISSNPTVGSKKPPTIELDTPIQYADHGNIIEKYSDAIMDDGDMEITAQMIGEAAVQKAKSIAPVGDPMKSPWPGTLRDSIYYEIHRIPTDFKTLGKKKMLIKLKSDISYAASVDQGHKMKNQFGGPYQAVRNTHVVNVGNLKTRDQPFLEVNMNLDEVMMIMQRKAKSDAEAVTSQFKREKKSNIKLKSKNRKRGVKIVT